MFGKSAIAATVLGVGLSLAAGVVLAASHGGGPFDAAIKARQAHMQLYAYNLGILGGMAKGAREYDAGLATAAAANLAALSGLNQAGYWPPGSDSFDNDNTAALPALWDNLEDAGRKGAALAEAVSALQEAAGNGLQALQGAIGPVGQACAACHKAYRKPQQ